MTHKQLSPSTHCGNGRQDEKASRRQLTSRYPLGKKLLTKGPASHRSRALRLFIWDQHVLVFISLSQSTALSKAEQNQQLLKTKEERPFLLSTCDSSTEAYRLPQATLRLVISDTVGVSRVMTVYSTLQEDNYRESGKTEFCYFKLF